MNLAESLAARWNAYWYTPAPLARLALFRIVVSVLAMAEVLGYARVALTDASAFEAGTGTRVWTPIYAFEALGIEPLGASAARNVLIAALIALGASALGLFTRVSTLAGAALTLFWIGLVYSFGKVHHDKVAFAFALLALAFAPCGARWSLDALLARRRGRPVERDSQYAATALRFVQVTLAIGYCAAGLSKLLIGGVDWLNGYTLMGIVMSYDNVAARYLCSSVELCQVASIVTVATEALFPLVLFFPALRWFFLPSVVAFHVATWWTMDTGPYMSLWLLLVAFLPLERVPSSITRAWREGRRARALAYAVVCSAALALVLRVLWYAFPPWTLALALPALAALVIALARDEDEATD